MFEDLQKLSKALDDKVGALVDAIQKADPLSEEYGKLLNNYNSTMVVASNTNRTIMAIAEQIKKQKEEEKKDEEVGE